MRELAKAFLNLVDAGTLIAGIGNVLKGDDGAGLLLLERLRERVDAHYIECGIAPENYIEKIAAYNPSTIILLDAAELGKSPGTIELLTADDLQVQAMSTHNLSLDLFSQYLGNRVKGVNIHVLGIQPQDCALEHGLSRTIKEAINQFLEDISAAGNRLGEE